MSDNLNKSRFLSSIDKYAKKKCLKLAEEIRQIENEKLLKEEVKIVEQARTLMMSELSDVKKKISIKIYKERMDAHKRILDRKSEIENEVFDLCKSRLEKFVRSDKYFDRLKSSIERASKIFGGSFEAFFCKKDAPFVKKLKDLFPLVSFSENLKIKSGGLILKKESIILDDSFDYHLNEQHKFFLEKFSCKLS